MSVSGHFFTNSLLEGKSVAPRDVFNTIHHLFTTYVDFRSDVEDKILALWIIGTDFYIMFPAYLYLTSQWSQQ